MWFVAKPFLFAVMVATIINVVPIALGAAIGSQFPGIFLAFTMAIGGILVFIGAIVSIIRIFKWAVE